MSTTGTASTPGEGNSREGFLARVAIGFTAWAEKWFPDAFVFVSIAVVVVAAAAMVNGASPASVSIAFGNGFWSLITFTMQMAFVAIGGYVVASSPPASRLIHRLARIPSTGPGAIGLVAAVSMLASLLNWGLSLIFGGLLVRARSMTHRLSAPALEDVLNRGRAMVGQTRESLDTKARTLRDRKIFASAFAAVSAAFAFVLWMYARAIGGRWKAPRESA